MAPNNRGLHAFVSGRVQGVWFRKFTQQAGQRLGLSGWVRNCLDGRVECQARGSEEALAEFEAFLQKGSPQAEVLKLEVSPLSEAVKLPSTFEVWR